MPPRLLVLIAGLAAAFSLLSQSARAATPGDAAPAKVIFSAPTGDLAAFRAFAIRAAALGATHIVISDLPKSRWQWDLDRSDPYPNWGMMQASIFKVVVPPELAAWLPADYARRNRDIIRARGAILRELGLKAVFVGIEPAWVPEAVFTAHPDWRGPRCDQPVRSRHAYYSMCVDQPGVLAIYRRAVAELCKAAPIDTFDLITNDSGGGFCWSASLYPGANGPSWCEGRSMADRITGFFSAIQAGAADAGIRADVSAFYGSGMIARAEVDSVVAGLRPGQALNGRTRDGSADSVRIGQYDCGDGTYPVVGIPQVEEIAEGLELSRADPSARAFVSLQADEAPWTDDLIRRFRAHPTHGLAGRIALIREVAAAYAGEAEADNLVDAFHEVGQAVASFRRMGGDPLLCVGVVNQRWLTRPFVPFPLELTPAERGYYRPFQFQANSEAEAADLMNTQGVEFVHGYSGAWLASANLDYVAATARSAADRMEGIAGRIADAAKKDRLATTASRLRAYACLCRTARNAINYQAILDRTDTTRTVRQVPIYPLDGDQRLRELQSITREEIDNVDELIGLLQSARHPLLAVAPTPAEEDIFLLNPDLVAQLRRKVRIMLDHQLDANRIYQRRQG